MSIPTFVALWLLFSGMVRDAHNHNRHKYSAAANILTAIFMALICAGLLWWGGDLS